MQQRAGASDVVDELFEVRTYYYIGAYQQCLNEINKIRVASIEKDFYMWRAYIAQGKYSVVLDGVSNDGAPVLQAIKKVAEYFAQPANRNVVVKWFEENSSASIDTEHSALWSILAGTVYYNAGLYEETLKAVHGHTDLECLAMQLQCLLRINRLDLARKVLAKMQEKDDDATLTQLALAWVNIETGGEKLQDAYYVFQDFCDKFVPTSMLLNGEAVCLIGQEKYEEAEGVLRDSLDKDLNNYDTLINSIALAKHTDKGSEVINRYLSQIKGSHEGSQMAAELEKKEAEFDRLCMKYEPAITQQPQIDASA